MRTMSQRPSDSNIQIPNWKSVLEERLSKPVTDPPEDRTEEIVFRAFERLDAMIVDVDGSCPEALLEAVRPPWKSPTFDWEGFQTEIGKQGIDHVSDVFEKLKRATTLDEAPIEDILFSEGDTLVKTFDVVHRYWGVQESRGRGADAFMQEYNNWHTRQGQRNEELDFKLEWTRASIANWISYISAMTLRTALFLNRNPDRVDEQSMRVRSFLKGCSSPFSIGADIRKCSRGNSGIRTAPCRSRYVCTVFVQSLWDDSKQETKYEIQACNHCREDNVPHRCSKAKHQVKSLGSSGNWRIGC